MKRTTVPPVSKDMIARELHDVFSVFTLAVDSQGESTTFNCLLFDDLATERLCFLRKFELHHKGALSCSGCIRDDKTLRSPACSSGSYQPASMEG